MRRGVAGARTLGSSLRTGAGAASAACSFTAPFALAGSSPKACQPAGSPPPPPTSSPAAAAGAACVCAPGKAPAAGCAPDCAHPAAACGGAAGFASGCPLVVPASPTALKVDLSLQTILCNKRKMLIASL